MTEIPAQSANPVSAESLYGAWPDRALIRTCIAQQLETDVARRLNMAMSSRGDDPSAGDQELDQAWPGLDQALNNAMAGWQYPDDLVEMLEEEARRCADHVLNQASEQQRRALEHAVALALTRSARPLSETAGTG